MCGWGRGWYSSRRPACSRPPPMRLCAGAGQFLGATRLSRPWLPPAIGAAAAATMAVYFCLRQFYAAFLLAYGSTVVVIT
eukprot:2929095-Pyramimonas_sp.AAC.1